MDNRPPIRKYERTPHLEDSRLQSGDEDTHVLRMADLLIPGTHIVVEEKLDGANSGFRFDGAGRVMAQSRGHYLDMADTHHPRERDFSMLKQWLGAHQETLLERFEDRYLAYGEWMAITHTVYYDRLPHLFMEFDIFDTERQQMLSTKRRRALCRGLPICSVPVLNRGQTITTLPQLKALVRPSVFKTPPRLGSWVDNLERSCAIVRDNFAARLPKMDRSDLSEGLYIKVETEDEVVMRAKWVRPDFIQTIAAANEHWQSRFPVPNLLDGAQDVFPPYLSAGEPIHQAEYDPDCPEAWLP